MTKRWLNELRERFLHRPEAGPGPTSGDPWRGLGRTRLLDHLDVAQRGRLRGRIQEFLADKRIIGARGYEPTLLDRNRIAVQACLPILHLDLACYGRFVDIIVYPDAFIAPRSRLDDSGVISEWEDVLSGESMGSGPVVLSVPGLTPPLPGSRECLVVHEFTHKLDEHFGLSDSPHAPGASRPAVLARELGKVHADFVARVERLERSMPADLDPESVEADAWYADLPLDPYAATEPAECLAVSAEAFFCADPRLSAEYPAFVEALTGFFGQRPLTSCRQHRELKYD
ncbi:MAG: zinc-dependent peptidase [Burkholderiaceae bacterium]